MVAPFIEGLEKKLDEFSFVHVSFEVTMGHPSRHVKEADVKLKETV